MGTQIFDAFKKAGLVDNKAEVKVKLHFQRIEWIKKQKEKIDKIYHRHVINGAEPLTLTYEEKFNKEVNKVLNGIRNKEDYKELKEYAEKIFAGGKQWQVKKVLGTAFQRQI